MVDNLVLSLCKLLDAFLSAYSITVI